MTIGVENIEQYYNETELLRKAVSLSFNIMDGEEVDHITWSEKPYDAKPLYCSLKVVGCDTGKRDFKFSFTLISKEQFYDDMNLD